MGRKGHFNSIKKCKDKVEKTVGPLTVLHLDGIIKLPRRFKRCFLSVCYALPSRFDRVFWRPSAGSRFKRPTRLKWHPGRNWNVGKTTIGILFLAPGPYSQFTYFARFLPTFFDPLICMTVIQCVNHSHRLCFYVSGIKVVGNLTSRN